MICQDSKPSTLTGWPVYCSLAAGHDGNHQAWGLDTVLEEWPSVQHATGQSQPAR